MELVVADVSHRYGTAEVLSKIDFTVKNGEIVSIIGPSGCGKSTLLGILGGLLQPTGGSVIVIGDIPAECLNPITYIFQDFALLPWMTVEQNVELILQHHPLSAAERQRRVDEVLAQTALSDFRSAFPKQLSGGMKQRCGIARALSVRPAIFLMDEPLSALDAQTRELLMADFLSLWSQHGTTAVYVTHNLDEALRLADRVIVLSRRPGQIKDIVHIGIAREARGNPEHLADLDTIRKRLWNLIRAEAAVADRELDHV